MWLTISSAFCLSLTALAEEKTPQPVNDPTEAAADELYVVVGSGLPVPLTQAADSIAALTDAEAVLILEKNPEGLRSLGWHDRNDLLDVYLNRDSADQHDVPASRYSPVDAYIDRKSPAVTFDWSNPSLQKDGTIHVRPDSRLSLTFSDDSGIDSWKAVLDQGAAAEANTWPAGNNRLIIFSVDEAGNPGRAGVTEFMVDGQPPVINCQPNSEQHQGDSGDSFYRLPLELACTVLDDSGVASRQYRTDQGWMDLPDSTFTLDSNRLIVSAMDRLNQRRIENLSWPVDQDAPEISIDLPDGGQLSEDDVRIKPGDRIRVVVDDAGVGVKQASYHYNDEPESALPEFIRFVDRGWYLLEVRAEDHFGQVSVAQWTVRAGTPRSQRPKKQ